MNVRKRPSGCAPPACCWPWRLWAPALGRQAGGAGDRQCRVLAHAPQLANPLNDAADIGAALGRLGFRGHPKLENAGKVALERKGLLHVLHAPPRPSETAVVFYAGHGIEVDKPQLPGAGRRPAG